MKINAISQEFPLASLHANRNPVKNKEDKPTLRIFTNIKNGFNNESPDFFKIDSMQENKHTYKNPFLGEVLQEDRNLFLKNLSKTREQIVHTIDVLKSNRDYSQNPQYLKSVKSSFDFDLISKRNQIKLAREKYASEEKNSPIKIDKSNDKDLYKETIKKLHHDYSPKHHYLVKKSLDFNQFKTLNNIDTPLNLNIDPRKSAYLKNYNDYQIKENYQENKDNFFILNKKEGKDFNCITDKTKVIPSEKYMSPKWNSFYEK